MERNVSRRQFLQYTGTATGALLCPVLSRPARAAEGTGQEQLNRWSFRRAALAGPWQVWLPEEDNLWSQVTLPHCYNNYDGCDPDTRYYQGQGWYRTEIVPAKPYGSDGRTLLYFRGAGQTTTVYLDDKCIGSHEGGYDEFAFDLTALLARPPFAKKASSAVRLTVVCDNSPDLNRAPSDLSDFCLYGGLYRHVSLVYRHALSIDMVHVTPTLSTDGSARVVVQTKLYGDPSTTACNLIVDLLDADGQVVGSAKYSQPAWQGFVEIADLRLAPVSLWSPAVPYLYRCRVRLSAGAYESVTEERFGIRHAEFLPRGPFHLNGQRLLLRGTHRHADHADVAAAMTDDLVRREMQMIRDMGANFIRLAHYQQDRLILDLCDELGLMVWEEVPWCRAGVGAKVFQQNVKSMLSSMILQHYNHPSIILWGLGNEDDWPDEYPVLDKESIRAFMTELRDLSHSLDATRLTSYRRCDFARDIPDVYSPSIWAGWYRGSYREYQASLEAQQKNVERFVHIEWGADSHAGRHSETPDAVLRRVQTGIGTDERGMDYLKTGDEIRVSKDGDWSETYACQLFDWHLKVQETLPWLTGSAQWVFKDFASPLRSDNALPRVNQKGVVERDLSPKEAYFVFQSFWAEKPMVRLYGHSWPIRWGKAGELRDVFVYSNCTSVELFLNGNSLGKRKRESQNFPAAGLRWQTPFREGSNDLRAVAMAKDGRMVSDALNFSYQTKSWGKAAKFLLRSHATDSHRVTIEAALVDKEETRCLDAVNVVRWSLTGEGRLLDNRGTTRGSRQLQLCNGRAEISAAVQGPCVISISAQGIPTEFISTVTTRYSMKDFRNCTLLDY